MKYPRLRWNKLATSRWLGLLLTVALYAAHGTDLYDAAVATPGRSAEDQKRDALDDPADVLRLTGLKPGPGVQVADVLAGDGYYSELLSDLVGPAGKVLSINNTAFDKWSEGLWQKRLAGGRLPNVVAETLDLNDMNLAVGSLDAVLLIKVYHDLYWVDPEGVWPKVDVHRVLTQLSRALKPGGVLLIVDHSAKPGRGARDASALHRIDEGFAVNDIESVGLKLEGRSDVLRRPEDPRDQISFKGPMLGKTDRFVLTFRKS